MGTARCAVHATWHLAFRSLLQDLSFTLADGDRLALVAGNGDAWPGWPGLAEPGQASIGTSRARWWHWSRRTYLRPCRACRWPTRRPAPSVFVASSQLAQPCRSAVTRQITSPTSSATSKEPSGQRPVA